jgi:hypothetical protein
MTCDGSRREYIQSVKNVISAAALLSDRGAAYIEALRDRRLDTMGEDLRDWHLYADTLRRLVDEQERIVDSYVKDSRLHRE